MSEKPNFPKTTSRMLNLFLCCASVAVLFTLPASAQIRLHDPVNDELAKKTRDAFNEFAKGDANVFDTMISNTLALKAATLAQLNDMNRQARGDKINQIPLLTWDEFLAEVKFEQDNFLGAYKVAHKIIDEALNKPVNAEVQNAGTAVQNAGTAVQNAVTLKDALAAAKKKLEALQTEQKDKENDLKAVAPKIEELQKSLDKLRDEVAASTKPIKRLSDLSEFGHLKSLWATVNDLRVWFEMAEKSANAPGLQLTILDLGVQHQQMQVNRIKLEIEQKESAAKLLERMDFRLIEVWGTGERDSEGWFTDGNFRKIHLNIRPCTGSACPPKPFVVEANRGEQILTTIGKLAKIAKGEVGTPPVATTQLRNLLDTLGRYVTLVGYQKYFLLADSVEAAADTHLYAIRLSALNTRDREMLVSHGLDGLAAYHSGGLKPEEIANFFRAVQSIAISVLAGRVE